MQPGEWPGRWTTSKSPTRSPSVSVTATCSGPLSQAANVLRAAVALDVLAVLDVAVDRRADGARAAAVIGVRVAEDEPRRAAQRVSGGADRRAHRRMAGVEHRHAAGLADEEDVDPQREPA